MSKGWFVGPAYRSQSVNADAQACVNFYIETLENPLSKSRMVLYPTPGLSLFTLLAKGPVRGTQNANMRCFSVGGDSLYEVFADGTNAELGVIGNDGNPASLTNGRTQLLVASNGVMSVYDLTSNTFTGNVASGLGPIAMVGYSDGYFIALAADNQKFYISSLLDATTWDPADVFEVSEFPDNVLSMIIDHREIWLYGVTKSIVYQNTGATPNTFQPIDGAFVEQGIGAPWTPVKMDNSVYWIGADERGHGVAWRAQGYTPQRISNHAIEFAWQGYSRIDDAIGYSYQDQGHANWVIYFPTANKTWAYDAAEQQWHERSYFNNGVDEAHLSRCHTFVFGTHVVGSRVDGSIYKMDIRIPDDNGQLIKRLRRAPHLSDEQEWTSFNSLQIDLECGLNPVPPPLTAGTSVVQITGSTVPGSTFDGPEPTVYAAVVAILSTGERRISALYGPFDSGISSGGDYAYARVQFGPQADVVTWQIFFSTDPAGLGFVATYTAAQIAAASNIINIGTISPPA